MKYIITGYLEDGEVLYQTKTEDLNAGLQEIDRVLSAETKLALKKRNPEQTAIKIIIEEVCECCGRLSVVKEVLDVL